MFRRSFNTFKEMGGRNGFYITGHIESISEFCSAAFLSLIEANRFWLRFPSKPTIDR